MATRRDFLKTAAATGAASSIPYFWSSQYAKAQDANSKPTIASIGVGGPRAAYGRGGRIAAHASALGQMIACCDVDEVHNELFNKKYEGKLRTYTDYRKLFEKEKPDVVTIGTPDHWHVAIAIHALKAGADVYCEKPLTLTIQEGIDICKVAKECDRVFQIGTQQRSMANTFLTAIAIVQSGMLGKKVNAHTSIGSGPAGGPFTPKEVPQGLDWNMWVGPTPKAEFSDERRRSFRWWFEYSGGKMTDWGAHHIDIAQWALGFGKSGPVKVTPSGKFPPQIPENVDWHAFLNGKAKLPEAFNTATEFNIKLEYANGAYLTVHNDFKRDDGVEFRNGILFEGEKGRLFVNRGKIQGKVIDNMSDAVKADIHKKVVALYTGKEPTSHMENFFSCLESRAQPVSDVFTHHRTMTSCHLCNISLMLGRELKWDPAKETFIGDDQATAMMSRTRRKEFADI